SRCGRSLFCGLRVELLELLVRRSKCRYGLHHAGEEIRARRRIKELRAHVGFAIKGRRRATELRGNERLAERVLTSFVDGAARERVLARRSVDLDRLARVALSMTDPPHARAQLRGATPEFPPALAIGVSCGDCELVGESDDLGAGRQRRRSLEALGRARFELRD